MKKLWLLTALCLLLTACGGPAQLAPDGPLDGDGGEPVSQVIFTYNGKDYNLQEREPGVNSLMGETQVGSVLVVEGHINPKVAYYGIFDTETETFVKDILGTNLTWRDDGITTAVYDLWSDSTIYGYDGQPLAELDLEESQYVYSFAWTDSRHLSVKICSDTSKTPTILELAVSDGTVS